VCITEDDGKEMEAVVFDTQKIAEAIRTVCEAFERIMEPVREAMKTFTEALSAIAERMSDAVRYYMQGFSEDMRNVARRLIRLLANWMVSAGRYVVRVVRSYDLKPPVRFAALICVLVKSHSAAYLVHICAAREGHLLRCQDRGSSDSVSDDDTNSVFLFTTFVAVT
jgi:hypothetical protein